MLIVHYGLYDPYLHDYHLYYRTSACDYWLLSTICVNVWPYQCIGLFDLMQRRKDRLPPDKSNAFWLEHLSYFDHRCSHLMITCAIKEPREQNETSRWGQVLQLLKIGCQSLDDDTYCIYIYSLWKISFFVVSSSDLKYQLMWLSTHYFSGLLRSYFMYFYMEYI